MSLPYKKLTFKWIFAWQVSLIKITSYISTREQFLKKIQILRFTFIVTDLIQFLTIFFTLIQFNHFYALIRISGTSGYFGIKATSVNILFIWNIFPFYVQDDYAAKTVRIA